MVLAENPAERLLVLVREQRVETAPFGGVPVHSHGIIWIWFVAPARKVPVGGEPIVLHDLPREVQAMAPIQVLAPAIEGRRAEVLQGHAALAFRQAQDARRFTADQPQ